MRRAWIAAAALLSVLAAVAASGCGPNPKELEPGLKTMLRDFAKAVVVNDKPTIQSYVIVDAGMRLNPLAAKDGETPEGREKLHEANRKWMRGCFRDAGIQAEGDIEAFMGALRMNIDGVNAWVTFEIAAEGRRVAEVVTFRLTRTEKGWRMFEYGRQMKGMR